MAVGVGQLYQQLPSLDSLAPRWDERSCTQQMPIGQLLGWM